MRWKGVATACLLVVLISLVGFAREAAGVETAGELLLTATVETSDLVARPVPDWRFKVTPVGHPDFRYLLTTDLDGVGDLALRPGQYLLRSDSPLELDGKSYSWEVGFRVESGAVLELDLSNNNALVEDLRQRELRVELGEDDVYRATSPSVLKVLSDSGHGSGFLIDSAGLVLTDAHLTAASDHLAVMVAEERKYSARLQAVDDSRGVALLQVNPLAVEELEPLVLAAADGVAPPCAAGEWVLAVGSPLITETPPTSGLVIRVEDGAIYTDARIDPDRFGGPLLNTYGEVVGINTSRFGTVLLHHALPLLESVRATRLTASAPPAYRLPTESGNR